MYGFTRYFLLAPYNLMVAYPGEIRNNYEILTIRQCDPVPVMFSFNEAARHCLMSGIFISETDLVHSCKVVNSCAVVNLFAAENIPHYYIFPEEKLRIFSV
jgi:hypothetical protein